jgi:hypothetical protein
MRALCVSHSEWRRMPAGCTGPKAMLGCGLRMVRTSCELES